MWSKPFFRSRYLLAIVAGVLLSAAFPGPSVAGFAWVAPALIIAAALGTTGAESFRIGYVAALAHYLSMLYWLLLIPYRWYGIPFAPALGWLCLSAFLALFPALWVWLVGGSVGSKFRALDASIEVSHSTGSASGEQRRQVTDEEDGSIKMPPRSWLGRVTWALTGAAVWVAFEMIHARILGGFPWGLLGASQFRMLPLIQVASITGIYGVSFLVIWVSLSLLSAGLMVVRRPTARSVWVGELFIPVIVVAILFNLGLRKLAQEPQPARTVKALLIQPSIPQTVIWDPSGDAERFQELIRLSEQALTNQADLIIWPEAAVPKKLRYDQATFDGITGLARRHHVWMIVGSDDAEPSRDASHPEDVNYFNSSFLISPEGRLMERYIKRNLVIFGEYLPLQHVLPFLKYFTPIEGGFTPGPGPVLYDLKDLGLQTTVLICFEDIFPQLARADISSKTDFLVNITNDGWFGEGPAQWQHATSALFRTVETGIPLVRCANNGLTCWIDASGRIRNVFHDSHGTIYGPGFLEAEVPLPPPGEKHSATFYTLHGDWFGWSCVAIAGTLLVRRVVKVLSYRQRPSSN